MEQVAISALQADIVHLALAAVGVLAVVIALLVFFGARAIQNILASFANTIKANSALTEVTVVQGNQLSGMLRSLEHGQRIQTEQNGLISAATSAIMKMDGQGENRTADLMQKLNGITDLVGSSAKTLQETTGRIINESEGRVLLALKPLMDSLANIKDNLDEEKTQQEVRAKKSREAFNAIEAKIANVSEQMIDVIQVMQGEIEREDTKQLGDGGAGAAGVGVSSGAASGSTGDSGTDSSGGSNDTEDGSAA